MGADNQAGQAPAKAQRLLHKRFPGRSDQLGKIRTQLRASLSALGCGTELVSACTLAVDEAITNIIRHAYGEIDGDIVLELFLRDDILELHLTDFAPPVSFSLTRARTPGEVRAGGLGVYLMRELMDSVELEPGARGGNVLTMTKGLR